MAIGSLARQRHQIAVEQALKTLKAAAIAFQEIERGQVMNCSIDPDPLTKGISQVLAALETIDVPDDYREALYCAIISESDGGPHSICVGWSKEALKADVAVYARTEWEELLDYLPIPEDENVLIDDFFFVHRSGSQEIVHLHPICIKDIKGWGAE